jgi:hypothetical protein
MQEAPKTTLAEAKAAVQKIIPKCEFEEAAVPNGYIPWDETGTRDVDRILAMGELWKYELAPKPTPRDDPSNWKYLGYDFASNPEVDKVWMCNSLGRSIDEVNEYADVVGPEECSNMPFNIIDDSPLLAKCIKQLDKNLMLGYWVVIRESEESDALQSELIEIASANLNNSYNQNTRPVLLGNGFAITMDGPFEFIPMSKIKNIDWVWNKIRKTTDLEPMGKYVSGYPKSYIFRGDDVNGTIFPKGGSREGLLDSCFDEESNSLWGDEGLCIKLANQMKN